MLAIYLLTKAYYQDYKLKHIKEVLILKILCNQKKLSNAITNAQRAINTKTNIEILRGILISADKNTLKVRGYDNEISIETEIEAQIESSGAIVINSKLIGEIVRKLPDTYISIETDDNFNVFISCMSSRFKIKGISASDFPEIESIESGNMLSISQADMKSMIRNTVFAAAIDNSNPTFNGELIEIDKDKINMAALDGYRLATITNLFNSGIEKNLSAIVPRNTLNHLNSLLADEGDLYIAISSRDIIFKFANTKIIGRLIDGEYADYKSLLPKDYVTKVLVETKKLQEAVERASLLFTSDKNNTIKMSVTDKLLVITSNNENGNAYEEISVEFEGDILDIAFNSRYFLDGIKYLNSEYVSVEFLGPINPCVIKPVDDIEYTYLILPVRVSN